MENRRTREDPSIGLLFKERPSYPKENWTALFWNLLWWSSEVLKVFVDQSISNIPSIFNCGWPRQFLCTVPAYLPTVTNEIPTGDHLGGHDRMDMSNWSSSNSTISPSGSPNLECGQTSGWNGKCGVSSIDSFIPFTSYNRDRQTDRSMARRSRSCWMNKLPAERVLCGCCWSNWNAVPPSTRNGISFVTVCTWNQL